MLKIKILTEELFLKNLKKFFDFLYKDSNESNRLKRKYDKFFNFLPSQDKTMRSPEMISAELSEEPVKLDDKSSRQFESEGVDKTS